MALIATTTDGAGGIASNPIVIEDNSLCYILDKVPRELRDMVYTFALYQEGGVKLEVVGKPSGQVESHNRLSLLGTCKQIREETGVLFFQLKELHCSIHPPRFKLTPEEWISQMPGQVNRIEQRLVQTLRKMINGSYARAKHLRIHFGLDGLWFYDLENENGLSMKAYIPAKARPYASQIRITLKGLWGRSVWPIQLSVTDFHSTLETLYAQIPKHISGDMHCSTAMEERVAVLCGAEDNVEYVDGRSEYVGTDEDEEESSDDEDQDEGEEESGDEEVFAGYRDHTLHLCTKCGKWHLRDVNEARFVAHKGYNIEGSREDGPDSD